MYSGLPVSTQEQLWQSSAAAIFKAAFPEVVIENHSHVIACNSIISLLVDSNSTVCVHGHMHQGATEASSRTAAVF